MKICSKCNVPKELEEFNKCKKFEDGLQKICKSCRKIGDKIRYENNKEKVKEITKKWKDKNPSYDKKYYVKNKIQFKKRGKEYYQNNKEQFKQWSEEYYQNNKEQIKNKVKLYQDNIRKDPVKNKQKKNKQNIYSREYYRKNPYISVLRNQIKNIREKLNTPKNDSSIKELGYSYIQFKESIENQFNKDMNWNNIGNRENQWNVDHKIPITWFKPLTPFNIVNSLDNLQPKWRIHNLEKSNKYSNIVNYNYYEKCKQHLKEDKINLVKYVVISK